MVSKDDLPASKYRRIAVFLENLPDIERVPAEQIVVSTLRKAGVNAISGPDVFKGRGNISDATKARVVQKDFEAVLYMTVVQKGVVEELVPNASHDGESVIFSGNLVPGLGVSFATNVATDMYILKPDGSVYQPKIGLQTRVDLQDTKTAKQVWSSETISSGHARVTNMNLLFGQASDQIIEKMRADGTI